MVVWGSGLTQLSAKQPISIKKRFTGSNPVATAMGK